MTKIRILIGRVKNNTIKQVQNIVGYSTGSEWEKTKNPTP